MNDAEKRSRYLGQIKEWRKNNPEKVKGYALISRTRNREKLRKSKLEWRRKNPDKVLEQQRRWRANNHDKVLEYRRHWKITHQSEIRFLRYQKSAESRGYIFRLSFKEFSQLITGAYCEYCGASGKMGIDRIDNSKGYLPDNVISCCKACNTTKGVKSKEEYIRRCIAVAKKYNSL